jgi:hypothetical protein
MAFALLFTCPNLEKVKASKVQNNREVRFSYHIGYSGEYFCVLYALFLSRILIGRVDREPKVVGG